MKGLEMITPKHLTLSVAAVISAVLLLGQPARALTAIAQPYLLSSWERVDAVQPIGHGRWHDYRGGQRAYDRPWPRYGYDRPWRRYGYHRAWRGYSALPYWRRFPGLPYKPWGPYEPCVNCPAFK
jgi:hypothetical protein